MIRLVLIAKSLRAFADGYVAILLPAYLLALGHGQLEVGILSTATLLGSALATLAVGRWGHLYSMRVLLLGSALLMGATGFGFASVSSLWPLLVVAFVGTINPSSGDVSVFQPLEHTVLAGASNAANRTTVFARYSFFGSLFAAIGALSAAAPDWLVEHGQAIQGGLALLDALRIMFLLYAAIGIFVWVLYLRIPRVKTGESAPMAPLGESRGIVWKLAALFSVDSFATGMIVNSLLALWLFERFGMSLTAAGAFFFWSGLASATSQLIAPSVAKRIGLINTMVFTHIPANLCLIAAAFVPGVEAALALLILRGALSQMDVPARSAYVMSVVTPAERPAAASFTAVPRSLAAAIGPTLGGAMFAAGMMAAPLVAAGALKIAYDVSLWLAFRRVKERQ
ncbi:MAG: MFS transporter [Betaproteobacteria bacterium]|nr:MFS transporter [Betaproteobacteria bacterium]